MPKNTPISPSHWSKLSGIEKLKLETHLKQQNIGWKRNYKYGWFRGSDTNDKKCNRKKWSGKNELKLFATVPFLKISISALPVFPHPTRKPVSRSAKQIIRLIEAATRDVLYERCSQKFRKIHRKKSVPESLF